MFLYTLGQILANELWTYTYELFDFILAESQAMIFWVCPCDDIKWSDVTPKIFCSKLASL